MTKIAKIKKGDKFVCLHPRMAQIYVGTVVALTTDPAKAVGLEFVEQVGFHSCDGKGKDKHCIWVRPSDILTEEEYAIRNKIKQDAARSFVELDELVLRT
jgi:hypothetical protein